jgi:hypothetical protein
LYERYAAIHATRAHPDIFAGLGEQAGIDPTFAQQGRVGALLHHGAVVQDDDGIAISDGAQAMGHDQTGAAALSELLHEAILGLGIQSTGGFIHDQEHRVSDPGSGDF